MENANTVWRVFIAWIAALGIAFSILMLASPVYASHEDPCGPQASNYDKGIKVLKEKYGESLRGALRVDEDQITIVELWMAPNSGTWTLLIRKGDCAKQLGAGTGYKVLDETEFLENNAKVILGNEV